MPDTYSTIALIAGTTRFLERCYACAAQQGRYEPERWGWDNRWHLAATPSWAAKVDSWIAGNPGGGIGWADDPAVISDADILSAVQGMLNPVPPEPA